MTGGKKEKKRAVEIIKAHLENVEPWDLFVTLPISAVRELVEK